MGLHINRFVFSLTYYNKYSNVTALSSTAKDKSLIDMITDKMPTLLYTAFL